MHEGQNILTPQSVQMVHPAKSPSLKVWPKISQSLPLIEIGAVVGRGIIFFLRRDRGIFSPHRSTVTMSLLLSMPLALSTRDYLYLAVIEDVYTKRIYIIKNNWYMAKSQGL